MVPEEQEEVVVDMASVQEVVDTCSHDTLEEEEWPGDHHLAQEQVEQEAPGQEQVPGPWVHLVLD